MSRWIPLSAVFVGGLLATFAAAKSSDVKPGVEPHDVVPDSSVTAPHAFTSGDIAGFLAARAKAEAVRDPLQRCLVYPDPPGSHWSHESVVAYCRYRLQPVIDRATLKAMLDSGRAKDVDSQLTTWMAQPQTHPEAFWRMISEDFVAPDEDGRQLLEAWKQKAPDSAFAYAASSFSFLQAAWVARGTASFQATPKEKIETMETLLERAGGDLRRALKIDPTLALPQAVKLETATILGDDASSEAVIHEVAGQAPSLPFYEALALAAQPRWGGSREAQVGLQVSIATHTTSNPLLVMVRAKILSEQLGVGCFCRQQKDETVYRITFDQLASRTELYAAGDNALSNGQYALAVVYLSEAARFDYPRLAEKLRAATAHLAPSLQSPP